MIIGAVIVVLAIIDFSFLLIGTHHGKSPHAAAKKCGITFEEMETDGRTDFKQLRYAPDKGAGGSSPSTSSDIKCFLDSMGISDKDASAPIEHDVVKREAGENHLLNLKTKVLGGTDMHY